METKKLKLKLAQLEYEATEFEETFTKSTMQKQRQQPDLEFDYDMEIQRREHEPYQKKRAEKSRRSKVLEPGISQPFNRTTTKSPTKSTMQKQPELTQVYNKDLSDGSTYSGWMLNG